MVSWSPNTGGLSNGVSERNSRNRFRGRLQAKGMSALSNIPEVNRRNIGIGELNRRIIDMKMEPGPTVLPSPICAAKSVQNITDLQTRLQPPQIGRRDSSNSNASSFYCSMKSADMSRRSSQTSQLSTMRPSYATSSFYDPISPGSSRRSSQLSTVTNGGQSLAPPPSSHLISTHLQRLASAECLSMTNADKSLGRGTTSILNSDRRMSEPVNRSSDCMQVSPTPRPRSTTPKSGGQHTPCVTTAAAKTSDHHPNQEVVLDEVEEDEMVENKLVIPDEMLQYLNEVADGDVKSHQTATIKSGLSNEQWRNTPVTYPLSSPAIPSSPATQIPISSMSNQITPSPGISLLSPMSISNRPYTPSQLCATNSTWNDAKVQRANQFMQQQHQQQTQYLEQSTTNNSNMNALYTPNNPYLPRQLQNSQQSGQPQHRANIYNSNNTSFLMENSPQPGIYYQMQVQQQQLAHSQVGRYNQNMVNNLVNLVQCMRTQNHCHRNDESAGNCCKMRQQILGLTGGNNVEIQCGDISQSQLSPALHRQQQQQQSQGTHANNQQNCNNPMQPQQQQQSNLDNCAHNDGCMHHSGMRQDTYQRTLEYVQNCQNWTENSETVSSSTHPSSNLIINDMTTSLNSLWEENRVFQMSSLYEENRVFQLTQ